MNKVFFISDTHFGHKKIIEYEDRPFSSVEEMDKTMIDNWNRKVDKGDRVYIIGDFAFADKEYVLDLLDKLNGQKFLIRGNHDHIVDDKDISSKFVWVKDYFPLKLNKRKYILFHYPIQVWDCKHHGSIHLYGHVHSNKPDHHPMEVELVNAYNVGADVNGFTPIEELEILKKIGQVA